MIKASLWLDCTIVAFQFFSLQGMCSCALTRYSSYGNMPSSPFQMLLSQQTGKWSQSLATQKFWHQRLLTATSHPRSLLYTHKEVKPLPRAKRNRASQEKCVCQLRVELSLRQSHAVCRAFDALQLKLSYSWMFFIRG